MTRRDFGLELYVEWLQTAGAADHTLGIVGKDVGVDIESEAGIGGGLKMQVDDSLVGVVPNGINAFKLVAHDCVQVHKLQGDAALLRFFDHQLARTRTLALPAGHLGYKRSQLLAAPDLDLGLERRR